MAKDEIPKLIQDFLYAQQHGLLEDEAGRAVTQSFHFGIVDDFVRRQIQEPVRKQKIAQAFLGPFQLPRLRRGELHQGLDIRGNEIRYQRQFLNANSITVGSAGSGKTTKSRYLILQLASKVKGLWCFDFRKREFAILRPYLKQIGVELTVVPARKLRLNPLQVPLHVEPADWASRIGDVLVQVLKLSGAQRASKLIHTTVLKLYRSFNIFNGTQHFPILAELRRAIAADAEANPQVTPTKRRRARRMGRDILLEEDEVIRRFKLNNLQRL